MNPDIRTAKKWYRWLWFSPLLTLPTLVLITFQEPGHTLLGCNSSNYRSCDWNSAEILSILFGIIGSSLWHLVLFIPALDRHSRFVRWHGWQALILAGIRTLIPLAWMGMGEFLHFDYYVSLLISIPCLIIAWSVGTALAQAQAGKGDCTLMRLFGNSAGLPLVNEEEEIEEEMEATSYSLRAGKADYSLLYNQGLMMKAEGLQDEAAEKFYQLILTGAPSSLKAQAADQLFAIAKANQTLDHDKLIAIFRFCSNFENRQTIFNRLRDMGMVEVL